MFPDRPGFCRLTKTRIPDHLGWSGTNRENRERFYFPDASQADFCDDRRFFRQMGKIGDGREQQIPRSSGIFPISRENRRSSQKSGTRREKRNALDFPDLSPTIPDDRGCVRFRVFIGLQNLRRSGNSEIPDRLGFCSRHMKTSQENFYKCNLQV